MSGVVLTQADTSPFLPQACLRANKQFTFGAAPPPWGMLPATFAYGFREPKSKSKNARQSNGHVGTWFGAATNNVVCEIGVLQADHGSRRWLCFIKFDDCSLQNCIRFFQNSVLTLDTVLQRSWLKTLDRSKAFLRINWEWHWPSVGNTLCFQTPRYQYVVFSFSARWNLLGPLLIFVTWWVGSWPWIHASGCFQPISEAEKYILNKCQFVRPSDGRHVLLDRVHHTWCTPSIGHPNNGTTVYRVGFKPSMFPNFTHGFTHGGSACRKATQSKDTASWLWA